MDSRTPALEYRIPSSKHPRMSYLVTYHEREGFRCECPDHAYRRRDCKHIAAVLKGEHQPLTGPAATTANLYSDRGEALDRALAARRLALRECGF